MKKQLIKTEILLFVCIFLLVLCSAIVSAQEYSVEEVGIGQINSFEADDGEVIYLSNQSLFVNHSSIENNLPMNAKESLRNQSINESIQLNEFDDWSAYVSSSFSGGNGTEKSPYLISSAQELALMAKYVNDYDPVYRSAYFKLTNDIDLTPYNWVPIGNGSIHADIVASDSNFFYGSFDGGNHTISGMNISEKEGIYFYGLFGCICGSVENVILEDVHININSISQGWQASNGMGSSLKIGGLAGSIAGFSNYIPEYVGMINNCICDAEIDVMAVDSVEVGGLAGNINYATVGETVTTGDIDITSERAIFCGGVSGGMGNESEITESCFKGTIKTINNGSIEDEETAAQGYSYVHYVGGFVGSIGRASADKILRDNYAEVEITSESEQYVEAGGFAGIIEVVYGDFKMENLFCKSLVQVNDITGSDQKFFDFTKSHVACSSTLGNGNNVVINNCGYIVGDDIYFYQNQKVKTDDNYTNIPLQVENTYKMNAEEAQELFFNQLGFNPEIWSIREGAYPVLQIEEKGINDSIESPLGKLTGFVGRDTDGNYYLYSKEELNNAYLAYQINSELNAAKMYQHLISNDCKIVALQDAYKGYIDYQAASQACLLAQIKGDPFDIDRYLGSDTTKLYGEIVSQLGVVATDGSVN